MKISVVTITYNSEKTVEETLKSVVEQSCDDLEYIIIDGGSTDNTLKIIENYRERIAVVVSEKDAGISDAFNKGIRRATGDIIAIINSDDLLLPGALKKIEETIKPETDVLYGNAIMFGNDRQDSISIPMSLDQFKYRMAVLHPSTFIRKRAYEKYGLYDLHYKASMDRDLLAKMYFGGATFQYCDFEFAKFRTGDGASSKQFYKVALKEKEEISLKWGASKIRCKLITIKTFMRFTVARILRQIGIGEYIRKIFHSKNTRMIREKK